MKTLFRTSNLLIEQVDTSFVRYLHDQIAWDARLIAILGARGVGKTTLMLQHIKLHDNPTESLYVTADDLYFSTHRLTELALDFYQHGGKHLYIDEIHNYKGWSLEIKNIYDQLPGLQVVYSGSSILELERGGADLSRRKLEYKLHGLSFREYLNIAYGWDLPSYTLTQVLAGEVRFPTKELRPLQCFQAYMQNGYYPFFKETGALMRLRAVVKQVVENDIPNFADMTIASTQKLKKLLYVLAQSVPFKPNYAKLERDLDIRRNTLPQYMAYLEKACLVNVLREPVEGIKILEKIEKIYLNNTALAYAISDNEPEMGTLRETLFLTWMQVNHKVTASRMADFEVEGYTFEVGGRSKSKRQIASAEPGKGFVVKDDIEYAFDNEIPLWMFGFLY